MGKYDAVLAGLSPIPVDLRDGGVKYQEKIDRAKETTSATELLEISQELRYLLDDFDKYVSELDFSEKGSAASLKRYAEFRSVYENIEEINKKIKVHLVGAEQLLHEAYAAEGVTSMKVDSVGTCRTNVEPIAFVFDKVAFHDWCVENGFGPQMSLMWQTTNSITKEKLLAAEEPPPGVNVFLKTKTTLTREKF